jgi:glutathione S-transferase
MTAFALSSFSIEIATPPTLTLWELGEADDHAESYSPFCLKIHRALKLLGLAYERRHASRPSELRDVNPAAQAPVLLVGREVVADSTAILRRLDRLRPGVLVPSDRARAAEAWLYEELADRSVNGFVVAARWADPRNWPTVREAYFRRAPWFVRALLAPRARAKVVRALEARDVLRSGLESATAEMRRLLDALEERAPYDGFWVGPDPCVADVALFAQLHALRSPLTPSQAHEVAIRPKLTDWLDRVDAATR